MKTDFVGQKLGDFEIVRELGRGGMGVVYEAVQISLNRRVALKVLGPGVGLTPRAVDRFRREAAAAAKLHHTNIVPVYATGEHDGIHFYAMELVDGPSLDAVIRQLKGGQTSSPPNELPQELGQTTGYVTGETTPTPTGSTTNTSSAASRLDLAATMIADVAEALQHAHQNGVSHRDIKPSNLLLSADGRLSVTDFGLARMLEQPGMTVTGEFVGTPAYMSPEQITAGRIPVDHRTDIYSLGATLYELLTLRPPFAAEGRDRLLAMVIQKEPAAPRALNPKIAKDLETICLKCLEKDPDRRYQTAKDLADDLRRYVNRFAILAKRSGPLARAKKWIKRNPAMAGLLALVLAAVGASGFFALQAHQTELRRLADEKRRDTETRVEKRREAIRNGMIEAMAGNFVGVNKAIDEALALDADAADVRILRGFAALQSGHSAEAVEHYEEAVKLRPDSVMARAGLMTAYGQAGEWVKEIEIYRILLTMTAATPEDMLFKGMAIMYFDDVGGLKLIEEAMQQKSMNIGFLLRLQARVSLLDESGSLADLKKALQDAATAQAIFPDHPIALHASLDSLTDAVAIYRIHKLWEERKAAHDEAVKLDAKLASFRDNTQAAIIRINWSRVRAFEFETPLVWNSDFTKLRQRTGDRSLTGLEGEYLFRNGKDREAIELLRTARGSFFADVLRFLATLDQDEFAAERDRLLYDKDSALQNWEKQLTLYNVRRAYGHTTQATAGMRAYFNDGGKLPPLYGDHFEKYYQSDAADREAELLKAVKDSPLEQSKVFLIGL